MDDGTRVSRRRQHEGEMMVMIDNPPSSFPVPALVDGSATGRHDGDLMVMPLSVNETAWMMEPVSADEGSTRAR
jgi:hypothetical protein